MSEMNQDYWVGGFVGAVLGNLWGKNAVLGIIIGYLFYWSIQKVFGRKKDG